MRTAERISLLLRTLASTITYIGGPTALLELDGARLLTDPTFDEGGGEYKSAPVTLRKLSGPALTPDSLAGFDYVLLSHDHHFDNLDHAGRAMLAQAKKVLSTEEGANRLGGKSLGLAHWQSTHLSAPPERPLRVMATPARHGPAGLNQGAVNGFVLTTGDKDEPAIYVSGDTVWYEDLAEVTRRFDVQVAILHLGAARVPEAGPFHLTMTAQEAVEAARCFQHAVIVPLHFEDWAHFSEEPAEISRAFRAAQLDTRVLWPERGPAVRVSLSDQPIGNRP